jgi:VIT1/CCC1 family predicted Fe2+/Mn2+ transporter
MRPKPSPRNQWNVSSMIFGDRLSHRSSMSMAANSLSSGLSSRELRLAWSDITSSVAYRRRPCRAAMRRAIVDLPPALPPPIQ